MSEFVAKNICCCAVGLTVDKITGDYASIRYETLPGNLPNTNGNYVAIWPAVSDAIPWTRLPDATCGVFGDEPSGDLLMTELALPEGSYIVAYSLAAQAAQAKQNNFCASVFIPSLAEGTVFTQKSMDLCVKEIGSHSAMIQYTALPGYTPQDHANWIGIWDARDRVLQDAPLRIMPIGKNSAQGEIALNNFKIVSGHSYTVAYFTGGYDTENEEKSLRTQLACTVTFDAGTP